MVLLPLGSGHLVLAGGRENLVADSEKMYNLP